MSETFIYAVKHDEEPICIGECRNAFRSAMYVWNDFAKKYFGLYAFPFFDDDMQKRIWNTGSECDTSLSERIVLASTMDGAIVENKNKDALISAFEEYGDANPDSSFMEQANIIRNSEIKDGYSFAWIQTSVSDGWFNEYNDEDEKYLANLEKSFDAVG